MPDRTSVPEQTTQAHCVTCSQGWSVLGCNVRDNFGDGGASLDLRLLHLQRKRDVRPAKCQGTLHLGHCEMLASSILANITTTYAF